MDSDGAVFSLCRPRLCAFVRLCLHARLFCDILVPLCACVCRAPAASRSRIREASPKKWSPSIGVHERVCVIHRPYPPRIARELRLAQVREGIGSDYWKSRHGITADPHQRGESCSLKRRSTADAWIERRWLRWGGGGDGMSRRKWLRRNCTGNASVPFRSACTRGSFAASPAAAGAAPGVVAPSRRHPRVTSSHRDGCSHLHIHAFGQLCLSGQP